MPVSLYVRKGDVTSVLQYTCAVENSWTNLGRQESCADGRDVPVEDLFRMLFYFSLRLVDQRSRFHM
jgi:hypothetical protein